MAGSYPDTLALSRKVLRVLIYANFVAGFLILMLLIATFVADEAWVMEALGADSARMMWGLRAIALVGICTMPFAHAVLSRLLAIVETVKGGDPFVAVNARRLQGIAWAILALEGLHLIVAAVANNVSTDTASVDIEWSFSLTRWLAVLLLFVLARVFEQGARMRDDLEGTV